MEETGAAGRSDGIRTNDDATLGCLTMVGSAALNVYCQNLNFISHIFCIFFYVSRVSFAISFFPVFTFLNF